MAIRRLSFLLLCARAWCQTTTPANLADATLEELMQVQVTSVSRSGKRLGKTAASVYVITAEAIRRSGLNLLPEILRLAPGVQVARSSSGHWAVSIRGFNDDSANKLLVLVDGRSIYNELASGVDWDRQAIGPEDIERIEVIRGPGSAMWGINAVNGVINIITKSAGSTQGGLVTAEGGSLAEGSVYARYGGAIQGANGGPPAAYYRMSLRSSDSAAFTSTNGQQPADGWANTWANFRLDWNASGRDSILFSGEAYRSVVGNQYPVQPPDQLVPALFDARTHTTGGSLLARWQHRFSDHSDATSQFSFEHSDAGDVQTPLNYDILTLGFQFHSVAGERQELVWGFDFREALYRFQATPERPTPFLYQAQRLPNVDEAFFAGFGEDQITLVPDKLEFIAGAQISHGGFAGFQVQPTGRLLWTPSAHASTWLAVSRAVRTPSVYERSFNGIVTAVPIAPGFYGFVHLLGDPGFRSETVLAYEAGQRIQMGPRFSIDASAFYNIYQHLASVTTGAPVLAVGGTGLPYLEIPTMFGNRRSGESYGGEVSSTFVAASNWKLEGGFSTVLIHTGSDAGFYSDDSLRTEGGSPEHEFQLHSYLDLTSKIELDSGLYYYGAMPALGIPRHLRGDVRLGWRPSEKWEVSAGVQDAFDPNHIEYISSRFNQLIEVPRNVYGKVTWRF